MDKRFLEGMSAQKFLKKKHIKTYYTSKKSILQEHHYYKHIHAYHTSMSIFKRLIRLILKFTKSLQVSYYQ
jgi:hypothetical protein